MDKPPAMIKDVAACIFVLLRPQEIKNSEWDECKKLIININFLSMLKELDIKIVTPNVKKFVFDTLKPYSKEKLEKDSLCNSLDTYI